MFCAYKESIDYQNKITNKILRALAFKIASSSHLSHSKIISSTQKKDLKFNFKIHFLNLNLKSFSEKYFQSKNIFYSYSKSLHYIKINLINIFKINLQLKK